MSAQMMMMMMTPPPGVDEAEFVAVKGYLAELDDLVKRIVKAQILTGRGHLATFMTMFANLHLDRKDLTEFLGMLDEAAQQCNQHGGHHG